MQTTSDTDNGQGDTYGEISAKTGIPKASLHRYIAAQGPVVGEEDGR